MSHFSRINAVSLTALILLTGCAPTTIEAPSEITENENKTPNSDTSLPEEFPSLENISIGENIRTQDIPDFTNMDQYYNQSLSWRECGAYECGHIWVPTDYDDLSKGMTFIAVARLASENENPHGSLLINPGGPGSSGVDFVFGASSYVTTERVRENFDLIGFDPRGVQYSDSVYCGPGEVLDIAFLDPGKQDPIGSPEAIEDYREEAAYLAEACLKGTGEDLLANIDTISAARDMDILRANLGDESLNYLGFSYGSKLGATYAALFPGKIGRVVLDGAIDPTLTSEESVIAQAGGFETAFTNYINDCLNFVSCPVEGTSPEEVKTNIAALLTEIEDTPIQTELDIELSIWPAVIGIISNLYSKNSWPSMSSGLSAASNGDGTSLLESAYRYLERTPEGEYLTTIGPSNHAINCIDDNYSTDPKVIQNTNDAIIDAAPFFGKYFLNPYLYCSEWPYDFETTGEQQPDYSAALSAPILVIGTTGDPATPFENAESLAELLNPGVLLTHVGEGHTIYANSNSCVDAIVDDFLVDGLLDTTSELICTDN